MSPERFLPLSTIQHELAISMEQLMGLIQNGELSAIRVCDTWRIERAALERFIETAYENAEQYLKFESHRPWAIARVIKPPSSALMSPDVVDLPPQLLRVLELVGSGMSNVEIAQKLVIEVSTVKSHVSRLLARLQVRDRENLIVYAWRTGIVRLEE